MGISTESFYIKNSYLSIYKRKRCGKNFEPYTKVTIIHFYHKQ